MSEVSPDNNNEGLICAFILDGLGGARRVNWDQVRDWKVEQGALWIHVEYENIFVQQWLEQYSELNELVVQSLIAEESRPRCTRLGGGLMVNLRGVNTNPGSEPEDMVSVRMFCDGQRLISARKRRLLSIHDISKSLEAREGPHNLGELISTLTVRLTERMSDVIGGLDDVIDQMEDEVIDHSGPAHRGKIVELRREIIMLRRYLAPQREALSRLSIEPGDWISESNRMEIRESTDRVTRYIEELDASRDRAAVIYEELSSRLAEQLNSRMYLLSIVAAVFLPLGFVTGLFGINVGGIPLTEDPSGFLWISLALIVFVIMQILIFKIRKWF